MLKIRKGDTVLVLKGKDRGKKAKVLSIFLSKGKALVEGINLVKKHRRQGNRQDQKGGIISIEAPIALANLMVFCKECNKGSRVEFVKNQDNTKSRVCKKCKGVL
ncbi:MAG: 50S ribosomal protein L24 [Candidatus Omnitrophica bacterium]|nr:50S ribosomal protein L24 [Candidatus Omnitrophota bacterium]